MSDTIEWSRYNNILVDRGDLDRFYPARSVPQKQPKRARLWLADGSCIRKRAERTNHVWSYEFVSERTHNGRFFRILIIVDEYT